MSTLRSRLDTLEASAITLTHNSPAAETIERLRLLLAGEAPLATPSPKSQESTLQRLIRERCEELGVVDARV